MGTNAPLIPVSGRVAFVIEGDLARFLGFGGREVRAEKGWAYEVYERPRPGEAPKHLASVRPGTPGPAGPHVPVAFFHAPAGAVLIRVQLDDFEVTGQVQLRTNDQYVRPCTYTVWCHVADPTLVVRTALNGKNVQTAVANEVNGHLRNYASNRPWNQVTTSTIFWELDHLRSESRMDETLAGLGVALKKAQSADVGEGDDLNAIIKDVRTAVHTETVTQVHWAAETARRQHDAIQGAVTDVGVQRVKDMGADGVSLEEIQKVAAQQLRAARQATGEVSDSLSISPMAGLGQSPSAQSLPQLGSPADGVSSSPQQETTRSGPTEAQGNGMNRPPASADEDNS